jgi:hypothetical protein
MDFRCPSCQKDLTVPDEYAGQLMKCPLCQNTFTAPALPPPVTAAPPPAVPAPQSEPGTYGVVTEPAPPPAPPPPPAEAPRRKEPAPPPPPPPVPTGDYTQTRTIWISPRVVPWIAPAALLVAFLLTFFTWAYFAGTDTSHMAWGWGFSQGDVLTILYLFMLLFAFVLAGAIVALRLMPHVKLPAGLQQVWPWRSGAVALLAFLGLFFLVMQLVIGFEPGNNETIDRGLLHTTAAVWVTLLLQIVALIAALLEFWLEVRGPSRPTPRVDIHW